MMGLEWITKLRFGFFGLAARRAVFDYLFITLLIMFLLLAVAWTVDLAKTFPDMRRNATDSDVSVFRILGPYLAYRTADILVRLLPVACFFGIFVAELLRRVRLETVILSASGSSPLRNLGPVLVYGVICGALIFQLENEWRPKAIHAQVALGHGAYAQRFAPVWTSEAHWFLYGDIAVRGEVFRADPPAMRDVLIFEGLHADRLQRVYHAARLDPTQSEEVWQLSGVTQWLADQDASTGRAVADRTMEIPMKPQELTHFAIPGFYLQNKPLHALVQAHQGSTAQIGAAVALWRRATIWLVPFTVAALALSLVRLGFVGRLMNIPRLIALGTTGYICIVGLKVFYAIGEIGGLSPGMATLGPIVILMSICAVLTWRAS